MDAAQQHTCNNNEEMFGVVAQSLEHGTFNAMGRGFNSSCGHP